MTYEPVKYAVSLSVRFPLQDRYNGPATHRVRILSFVASDPFVVVPVVITVLIVPLHEASLGEKLSGSSELPVHEGGMGANPT